MFINTHIEQEVGLRSGTDLPTTRDGLVALVRGKVPLHADDIARMPMEDLIGFAGMTEDEWLEHLYSED